MKPLLNKYYFLCFFLLLTACDGSPNGGSPNGGSRNGNSTNGSEGETRAASQNVYVRSGTDTLLTSDSLMQRFVPQWDVQYVMDRLPDAEISKREPVENRHVPGQVDTLLTISNGSSSFRFYQLPDEVLLQGAHLEDEGLTLGGELEAKMAAAELRRILPALQGRDTIPELIRIEGELSPQSLLIRLNSRRLQVEEIEFQGYID